MPQPRPWLDEVIDALRELGGEGQLSQIYARVRERGVMDFEANVHWEDRIRGTIETHSSDSAAFNPNNDDLFQSVNGLGQGRWRLRQPVVA